MPSALHEALVQIFRNRPTLAPELLSRGLGVELPAFAEARVSEATFADLKAAEYRADLVVLLANEAPVLAIVIEVQLARDRRKVASWPMYAVGLRAKLECPTCVLVLAMSEDVAAWARAPIAIGPGNVFTPLVVGPAAVPLVASLDEAAREPELAVLSAMAHGRDDALAETVAASAARAVAALDHDYAVLYFDLIRDWLGPAARRAFEELFMIPNHYEYEFQSEYFRKKVEAAADKAAMRAVAEAVLTVLRARGVDVSGTAEARIRACADLAQMNHWLTRAVTVDFVDALFD